MENGFINRNGEASIPLQYDDARNFGEGLAAVKQNKTWGFIDAKGNIKIPVQYDDALFFHNGIARVSDGKKNFYIDELNKWVKDEERHEEELEMKERQPKVERE